MISLRVTIFFEIWWKRSSGFLIKIGFCCCFDFWRNLFSILRIRFKWDRFLLLLVFIIDLHHHRGRKDTAKKSIIPAFSTENDCLKREKKAPRFISSNTVSLTRGTVRGQSHAYGGGTKRKIIKYIYRHTKLSHKSIEYYIPRIDKLVNHKAF